MAYPTQIYFLKVSVGWKSRHGSGSRLSEIKVSAGAEASPKAGGLFQDLLVVERAQLL